MSGQETLQIDTTPPPGYVTLSYAFEQFNTAQATSGLLLERSFPLINLGKYDGQNPVDTNKVSAISFGLAYARLAGSALNPASQLPDPTTTLGPYASSDDTISIKTLYYQYHRLKPNALNAGEIEVHNNQLINVSGQNPFELRTAFLASPWAAATLVGDTFAFRVQAPISNNAAAIQSISMDFGDGQGWRTVTVGQVLHIGYAESDTVIFRYRLMLNGGILLESHSEVVISIPPQNRMYGDRFNIPGITGATVTGISSCGDQTICKPLIVVEGFNAPAFGDAFDTDIVGFIAGIISGSGSSTPTGSSLYDEFEDGGYDIVYVDFTDGTDDLYANAEVVKNVIRKVNELKAEAGCTEKNVVLGQSMGGVLAKLALRQMEEADEDHGCYKLITHDSPLRGANIPLGYQWMLDHVAHLEVSSLEQLGPLKNFIPLLNDALYTLRRPGPSQMLIYHKDFFTSQPSSPSRQFYTYLRGLGALEHCEHIAISNGSQILSGQGFGPNARMLRIEGSAGDALADCTVLSGSWAGLIEFVVGFSGTGASVDFSVNAVPSPTQGMRNIYFGKVSSFVSFIPIINSSFGVSVGGTQPIDCTSGGYVEIPTDKIPSCFLGIVDIEQPRFCFVPTVSAIEVGPIVGTGPLSNPDTDVSNNAAIMASGLTTVDRYVAWDNPIPAGASPSTFNQSHISYSTDNTGVILYELKAEPSPTGLLNNRTYNYGKSAVGGYNYLTPPATFPISQTSNYITGGLTIEGTGKIWINRNDRIAFTDVTGNPQNLNNSLFSVTISTDVCEPASSTVVVKNGGEIIVGECCGAINNKGVLRISKQGVLDIQRGGKVEVTDQSTLFVEGTGFTHVREGGFLNVSWANGKIVVKGGGTLRVYSGGILRVSNGAQLLVEAGGKLILDAGAKIQLWDGSTPDGASNIHLNNLGELVINGDIDFSGNGYFQFSAGHRLTLNTTYFRLEGLGKNFRFIKLNNNCSLSVNGNHGFDFKDGEIAYGSFSSISPYNGGKVILNNIYSNGYATGGAKGVVASDPGLVQINNSDFIGLEPAVYLEKVRKNVFAGVFNSTITEHGEVGIEALLCDVVRFGNLTITGNENSICSGIWLSEVQHAVLTSCNITDEQEGVETSATRTLTMSGGEIAECIYGISDQSGLPSNVLMLNGATIRDCDAGITMTGDGTDGSVLMDCARLINNGVGIQGTDIILLIDAEENRKCIDDPLAPNTFIKGSSVFFDICYSLLSSPALSINAKGNFWEPHLSGNFQPVPGDWWLFRTAVNNPPCKALVPFDPSNAAEFQPLDCPVPTTPCNPPGTPGRPAAPNAQCEVVIEGDAYKAHKDFHEGMEAIQVEDFDQADTLFSAVAELHGVFGQALDMTCQNYINMAHAIFPDDPAKPNKVSKAALADPRVQDITFSNVVLMPNPATDQVWLVLPSGNPNVLIYNDLGQVMYQNVWSGKLGVSVKDWKPGMYIVRINADSAVAPTFEKLVVQH